MKHLTKTLTPIALAMAFSLPAVAAASSAASDAAKANGFSVKFVTGGGSSEARKHMQHMASEFDLLLEFDAPAMNRDYRNVEVKMSDDAGKIVLDAPAAGPLFSIQIPPGHYTVTADLGGKQQVRSVDVAAGSTKHLTFDWQS